MSLVPPAQINIALPGARVDHEQALGIDKLLQMNSVPYESAENQAVGGKCQHVLFVTSPDKLKIATKKKDKKEDIN